MLAAAIIAAASEFDTLTHDGPGRLALTQEQALRQLEETFAGGAFETGARAVAAELHEPQTKEQYPAGLTDREVEVLRLLASGLNRKKIAGELVLSESTVRSHLEHIYGKLDVSTRVGAVLFAIEHGLLP